MAITLTLTNVDSKATSINIYRSVGTPVPAVNPGTPYATIAPAATWTDTDVVNYNVYHYRVEVSDGSNKTISDNQMVGYYPDSGPGNNTVRRGDWVSGWMDELSVDQFITGADLLTWVLAQGVTFSATQPATITQWAKVAYRGKVLMIPNAFLGSTSWVNVYNGGLMYGTNDMGAHPVITGLTEKNQRKTIQVKGNTYIVRTLHGTLDDSVYYPAATVAALLDSENAMTRVRLCDDGTGANGLPRFSDYAPANMNTILATAITAGAICVASSNSGVANVAATANTSWMPILELAPGL